MVTSPCDFYQPRQQRPKARAGKPAILIHVAANARADAPADAGEPLRRTTADAKNHQKMAADAFPAAFEKYKVIESNPPCGCPMGCVTRPADAQWGVWHIVWGGGGLLPFPPLPSVTPSCCGVLFFPLAASMPLSKLGLATR